MFTWSLVDSDRLRHNDSFEMFSTISRASSCYKGRKKLRIGSVTSMSGGEYTYSLLRSTISSLLLC